MCKVDELDDSVNQGVSERDQCDQRAIGKPNDAELEEKLVVEMHGLPLPDPVAGSRRPSGRDGEPAGGKK
jgi:hypothetical protein